ncbi:hypothetical protein [Pelagicoccus mobilis]|uniref:Uncharacterized protein n=1 Tax=Pelagicoccus mobilis TaxID=415221 RepID=A0A934S255_9BACT|nr:hypothetical protein [Pelagicoccus mobilis]MBK1878049.1 hypothetical protein [Pelagicoccus mobilis]
MVGRLLILSATLCVVPLKAQDSDSPFKTPSRSSAASVEVAPPPVTTLDGFQFNGIMEIGDRVRISLYDTKAKRNIWVDEDKIGEFGVSFSRFDPESETVVIAQGGVSKKLSLNKVKIESLKIAPKKVPPVQAATAAATATPGRRPGERVESDEEARARIQRVAEEIRRRRAERRQQLEERNRNTGN